MDFFKKIKFSAEGLVPVIAQDFETKEVLMMAWANLEALENTVKTNKATYFSRSRQKLWCKGEESGNYQEIKEICIDCDMDTILYLVEQRAESNDIYDLQGRRVTNPTKGVYIINGKKIMFK